MFVVKIIAVKARTANQGKYGQSLNTEPPLVFLGGKKITI